MVKVMLVGPHSEQGTYTNPPSGILYLHAMLRANGIDVVWRDENQGDMVDVPHDITAISMMTSNRHRALELARQAKDAGRTVIVGGPHPTLMYEQLLNNYPFIDACCHGDGEHTMLALAQGVPYASVPGLAWRSNGTIVHTTRKTGWSLDDLPFPSFDTVDFKRYVGGARIFFSRGCAYAGCMFCSVAAQWGRQRWRSPKNMVEEMLWLKSLGQNGFALYDDCLTGDMDLAALLFEEMIDKKVNDMWWCGTTRVGLVSQELIRLMVRAGCQELTFGVETAHPEAMRIYAKGQTIEQAERAVNWCKEAGLRCSVLMIYQGIRAAQFDPVSHAWVAKMGVGQGSANELQIFPGTPLYRAMVANGKMDDSFWLGPQPFGIYKKELDHLTPEQWAEYR